MIYIQEDGRIERRDRVAKEPFKGRMVENRLKWARHVERMAEDRLTESRCRPRGRQERRKTTIEMGGLREKRRQECRGRA